MPKPPIKDSDTFCKALAALRRRNVPIYWLRLPNGLYTLASRNYPHHSIGVIIWCHFYSSPLPSSTSHAFRLWGASKRLYKTIQSAIMCVPGHDSELRAKMLAALNLKEPARSEDEKVRSSQARQARRGSRKNH